MISSITPVGERTRGQRWWLTTAAYVVGSGLAGLAFGALLGMGSIALRSAMGASTAVAVLAVVAVVGLAADLSGRLPSWHRQVDERWLTQYRGWVYGLGFGAQLGTGVMTIVASSATYVVLVAAALSGSVAMSASMGATFGLVRALPVLLTRRLTTPERLHRHFRIQTRLGPTVDRVVRTTQACLAAAAAGYVMWGP